MSSSTRTEAGYPEASSGALAGRRERFAGYTAMGLGWNSGHSRVPRPATTGARR
jgi:hypothetical protein